MSDLLGGRLGVDAYTRYTEQLWFVYRALEEAAGPLADDPVAGPFVRPELVRTAALERDLDPSAAAPHWRDGAGAAARHRRVRGPDRRSAPATGPPATSPTTTPATSATSPAARSSAARRRRPGASPARATGSGSTSSRTIANPAAFKREYRALLDALPVDDLEKQRVVDECKRAFAPEHARSSGSWARSSR